MVNLATAERRKYEDCWSYSQYRNYSPGVWALPLFRQLVRKRGTLIDLGCGTGRAGAELAEAGFEVTLMDFADNCLDFKVKQKGLPFIRGNLWSPWKGAGRFDYGYCCDVLEHIPPDKVDKVLRRIFAHCDRVFLNIHFGPDNFGKVVGHPLHLTVQPFVWWLAKLGEYGDVRDARDLLGMGAFFVSSKC